MWPHKFSCPVTGSDKDGFDKFPPMYTYDMRKWEKSRNRRKIIIKDSFDPAGIEIIANRFVQNLADN